MAEESIFQADLDEVRLEISREYFKDVRRARLQLLEAREDYDRASGEAGLCGVDYSKPFVDTSFTDTMPERVARAQEMFERFMDAQGFFFSLYDEAVAVIEQNEHVQQRRALKLYYLEGLAQSQIAEKMSYEVRTVKRILNEGLLACYEFLPEENKRTLPKAWPGKDW